MKVQQDVGRSNASSMIEYVYEDQPLNVVTIVCVPKVYL